MQMLLEGYLPGPSEEFKSSIAGDEFEVADMVLEGGPWKTISGFCRRAAEERSTGTGRHDNSDLRGTTVSMVYPDSRADPSSQGGLGFKKAELTRWIPTFVGSAGCIASARSGPVCDQFLVLHRGDETRR
ncbi:hypothetical protein ACEPPN_005992 [Leptodophora sp. 'Broadleaf-Isolate-01']